jgi:peptidoglycan/LPS O-acetylase OafA/YrhL
MTLDRHPPSLLRFDSLTSLRGIAAMLTVFIHLAAVWAEIFPSMKHWTLFRHFALHSYLFVDFFFILSGFVMSHVYGNAFRDSVTPGAYVRFLRARFARVYPLHFVLLALYVALAAAGIKQAQENPDWSITANLLLVQALGFFDHPTWDAPSWSISVEWWTYMIFPFAVISAQRHARSAAMAAAGLALAIGGFFWLSIHFGSADLTVGYAFVRCLLGFLAGASLYRLFLVRRNAWPSNAVTIAAMIAVLAALTFAPSPFTDIFAFICFCALVYATSTERQWLHQKTLVWLGDISYSIYLWHTLLLHVVAKIMLMLKSRRAWPADHDYLYFFGALLLFELGVLITAHLSHRFIEVPLRNRINSPRKTTKIAPAPAL